MVDNGQQPIEGDDWDGREIRAALGKTRESGTEQTKGGPIRGLNLGRPINPEESSDTVKVLLLKRKDLNR